MCAPVCGQRRRAAPVRRRPLRVGNGLWTALGPPPSPYRTPGHEPPQEQQPDVVQEEDLHVEGQRRRRSDEGALPGHHDPLALPPGLLLRSPGHRTPHRLVCRPDGQLEHSLRVGRATPRERSPVWRRTTFPLAQGVRTPTTPAVRRRYERRKHRGEKDAARPRVTSRGSDLGNCCEMGCATGLQIDHRTVQRGERSESRSCVDGVLRCCVRGICPPAKTSSQVGVRGCCDPTA